MKHQWDYSLSSGKKIPVYNSETMTLLEKLLFNLKPTWKIKSIDGTIWYKKADGVIYITKFEALQKEEK